MPHPGTTIERSTLCCKTFQDTRNAGILTSFQPPSWGKASTGKTATFLHHFFFSTFAFLRKHDISKSCCISLELRYTAWVPLSWKWSSGISLQMLASTLPPEGQPTNISLTSNQTFHPRWTEPKLSKSSSQTKIFCLIFLGKKNLSTICIFSWNLILWENYFLQWSLPENIPVENSNLSLSSSVPATYASCLPHGKRASVKQATSWDRRHQSYLSASYTATGAGGNLVK